MLEVMKANPPGSGILSSVSNAEYMLIRQKDFPFTYEDDEMIFTQDSDRSMMFNYDHANLCIRKHTGGGQIGFDLWIISQQNDKKLMDFIKDFTNADPSINWTGYRIMGTVGGNGQTIFTFQLFAKNPKSKTLLYSSKDAPNVLT